MLSDVLQSTSETPMKLFGDAVAPDNLVKTAELLLDQFADALDSPKKHWFKQNTRLAKYNFSMESRKISGPWEGYGVPIQRSSWAVRNCSSARNLYEFLTTPEGFASIDPLSRIEQHLKPPVARTPIVRVIIPEGKPTYFECKHACIEKY